jgi:hypothetical protein
MASFKFLALKFNPFFATAKFAELLMHSSPTIFARSSQDANACLLPT